MFKCMKNRFNRAGRLSLLMLALVLMGGLAYSCSDDYDLPDTYPSWLGSSIYDYLNDAGNYTNTVKLIEDLSYDEVLAKTGSKTLFVADDDAFEEFYKKNDWGVTCYEDLTQSQKKLLLKGAMLDNPYLLEMMSSTTSSSLNEDGKYLSKNTCLRRTTSTAATDSIAYFAWDSDAIPISYNDGTNNSSGTADIDYWSRFRTEEKGGIRLATDGTEPLMIHWIAGQMSNRNITDEDFEMIVGQTREASDVHIFGSKVIEQDITCQNGYIDVLDAVFTTPQNMAEVIRTNGRTDIYSHMLDRFAAPFYSSDLTSSLQQLEDGVDSVFRKQYFNSDDNNLVDEDPDGTEVSYYLKFDPGWSSYYNSSYDVQQDMGAMIVPSDEAIKEYFLEGGGVFLMDAYATQTPVTEDNLIYNLDQIPLDVIQALINNLMIASFIGSVPSKYLSIMNDARDAMFSNCETVEDYKALIDTCLIANNGVVYVLNEVYTPAKYASVSAPVLVADSTIIINWAVTCDDSYITSTSPYLQAFMSTYLLAMSTNFAFFVPTDNALGNGYYDPVSHGWTQPRVLKFGYTTSSTGKISVTATAYRFDETTLEIGDKLTTSISSNGTVICDRLYDILDQHVVVDESDEKLGVLSGNEWFISKGGAPVKVSNPEAGVDGMKVYGSWQLETGQECNITEVFDKTEATNGYGNGMTYFIDAPIESTVNSVYTVLAQDDAEDSPYEQFFNLCMVDTEVLEDAGFADDYSKASEIESALQKYSIFTSGSTGSYAMDQNVRFFSTYRYTLYVPTNDAIEEAINSYGLPTWETIRDYLDTQMSYIDENSDKLSDSEISALETEYKTVAQAMCTCLMNFVRYHFHDESVFADILPFDEEDVESACINTSTGRYITVNIKSDGNHTLTITDQAGNVRNILTGDGDYNICTRDLVVSATGNSTSATIETSSFCTIHRIDGVLNFKEFDNGRYDSEWSTTANAARFVKTYEIQE